MDEERSVTSSAPTTATAVAAAGPHHLRDDTRVTQMELQVEQMKKDMDDLRRGQVETAEYLKGMKGELAQEVEARVQQAAGNLAHQI